MTNKLWTIAYSHYQRKMHCWAHIKTRAVGTIVAIAAMATTLFSNYLTCDIQNSLIKLAALQYTFLQPCFLVIIASLSCYPMKDSMGLVASSIIKIIITGASSKKCNGWFITQAW